MKRVIIILFSGLAALSLLPSCEKWLEATSSSQVSDKMLFSSRTGFHEALNGIYLEMGKEDTYGRNYTWFVNELTSSPLSANTNNNLYKVLQQHSYSSSLANPYIESMWKGGYAVIANANKVLYELERHRDIIADEREYNLIRGELLAVRAYVHFDLMRMFGLESWTGNNAGKLTVPYVKSYSSTPTAQLTYEETARLLQEDIAEALSCLEDDPVVTGFSAAFNESLNADGYWTDRQKHFNYYAVLAFSARVAIWRGEYAQAANLATKVIDGAFSSGLVSWIDADAFLQETEYDYRDWTFSCEHLMSLEVTTLYDNLKAHFFPSGFSSGIFFSSSVADQLFMFSETGDLSEDIRGPACLMRFSKDGYALYKFYGSTGYLPAFRSRMPLIRLSEMYYILAEACLQAFDGDGAIKYLDVVRFHRGNTQSISSYFSDYQSAAEIRTALLWYVAREYLIEMVGEGQFFYLCKRFTSPDQQTAIANVAFDMQDVIYPVSTKLTYPYPVAETTYGRKQEI